MHSILSYGAALTRFLKRVCRSSSEVPDFFPGNPDSCVRRREPVTSALPQDVFFPDRTQFIDA